MKRFLLILPLLGAIFACIACESKVPMPILLDIQIQNTSGGDKILDNLDTYADIILTGRSLSRVNEVKFCDTPAAVTCSTGTVSLKSSNTVYARIADGSPAWNSGTYYLYVTVEGADSYSAYGISNQISVRIN